MFESLDIFKAFNNNNTLKRLKICLFALDNARSHKQFNYVINLTLNMINYIYLLIY